PAHRRRAERPWPLGVRDDGEEDPARGGARPGWVAWRTLLAGLPAGTSAEHARGRLLQRRNHRAATAVRALLHRARSPPRPRRRLHRQPNWIVGRPAGAA